MKRLRREPEAAVDGVDRADLALEPVVRPHGRDRLSDLLAVRTDVLDRGRAGRSRYAGQCLDADPALVDGPGDDAVPRLAGGDRDHRAATGVGVDHDAARQHADDGSRHTLVGHHQVAAAGDDEDRVAGLVGDPDGVEQLLLGGRVDHGPGGATEAQRRQLGEVHGGDASSVQHDEGSRLPEQGEPSNGRARSAGLAVDLVGLAARAELLEVETIRVVATVLLGDVVAFLALGAGQGDLGANV
nr:hypothetical protein [uncultured bacterium]